MPYLFLGRPRDPQPGFIAYFLGAYMTSWAPPPELDAACERASPEELDEAFRLMDIFGKARSLHDWRARGYRPRRGVEPFATLYSGSWDPDREPHRQRVGDPIRSYYTADQVERVYLIDPRLLRLLPADARAAIDANHRHPDPYYAVLPEADDLAADPALAPLADAILELVRREFAGEVIGF